MQIELIEIAEANIGDNSAYSSARAASMLVVVLSDSIGLNSFEMIAEMLALGSPGVVSVWGKGSEQLHDLLDHEFLKLREIGPITMFDTDSTLGEFIWLSLFPYQGLDDAEDGDRRLVIAAIGSVEGRRESILALLEEWNFGALPAHD